VGLLASVGKKGFDGVQRTDAATKPEDFCLIEDKKLPIGNSMTYELFS
jgi:hypothetical protein